MLLGGRLTVEDAYAYSKFARIVLGTNDIDFRARPHSDEEAQFLAARVAGRPITISYSDLESAPVVLLAGFEPEEESPIVYLRLRKAARKRGLPVHAIAPFATQRAEEDARHADPDRARRARPRRWTRWPPASSADLLSKPGAIIIVGERLAGVPGGLSAAARLADSHRRATGVGASPRRGTRRAGGRRAAGAAARRPPGRATTTARAQVAAGLACRRIARCRGP